MIKFSKGFTLMELMVAVAIVGIIASIAIPSYKQYIVRSNRSAVQAELMQIANALERYRAQQLSYKNAVIGSSGTGQFSVYPAVTYPASNSAALYVLSLAITANNISWTLTAKPISGKTQAGSGMLQIDNTGQKCWNKASDTVMGTCSPWN